MISSAALRDFPPLATSTFNIKLVLLSKLHVSELFLCCILSKVADVEELTR